MRANWKPVVGFVGLYEVSEAGHIRSVSRAVRYAPRADGTHGYERQQRGARLAPQRGQYGHCFVTLCNSAGHHRRKVHTLVLEAFVGPCPPGLLCRHLDGNAGNNKLSNLRWGTPAENEADKLRHGRAPRGSKNARAKLTEADVPAIFGLAANGGKQRDIATAFGVSQRVVWAVLNRKTWRHVEVDAEALRRVVLHVAGVTP